MINKEDIQKRKEELEGERSRMMVQLNALSGAIQDCTFWLSQYDKEEPKKTEAKVTKVQPKKQEKA